MGKCPSTLLSYTLIVVKNGNVFIYSFMFKWKKDSHFKSFKIVFKCQIQECWIVRTKVFDSSLTGLNISMKEQLMIKNLMKSWLNALLVRES
jgi:hypothetical protein